MFSLPPDHQKFLKKTPRQTLYIDVSWHFEITTMKKMRYVYE